METESLSDVDINITEKYQSLESNKLISYELSTSNKITPEFTLTEKEKTKLTEQFQKLYEFSALYTDLSNVNTLSGEILENLSLSKPNLSKLKRNFEEITTYFSELNSIQDANTKDDLTKKIKDNRKATFDEFNILKKYFIETNILPKYRDDEINRIVNIFLF